MVKAQPANQDSRKVAKAYKVKFFPQSDLKL